MNLLGSPMPAADNSAAVATPPVADSPTTIAEPARRGRRPTEWWLDQKDKIQELVEAGKNKTEIAKAFDCATDTLTRACARAGIELRPSWKIEHANRMTEVMQLTTGETSVPTTPRVQVQLVHGEDKRILCSLDPNMLGPLLLAAELRDLRLGQLIRDVLVDFVKQQPKP